MPGLVAPRKTKSGNNHHACLVCALPTDSMQVVNAAIWDGSQLKVRNYRERGAEAYELITGKRMEVRTIQRHAKHVELTWHEPTEDRPERSNELPVFPSDYEGLVDTAASLSARAMSRLSGQVDQLTPTELISAAKIGVTARGQQEATKAASKQPQIDLKVIFGLASGHLSQLPASEVIDVTPESDLKAAVHAERLALEAHSKGG